MIILFCSCKKSFLEETNPNAVAVPQLYTSETDALLALNGCYESIRDNNCIAEESDLFTDQRSDDTGTNDSQSNSGEPFQFGNYSLLPTNSYMAKHWLALYTTITRCNQLLANIDAIKFASDSTKTQYEAEAKFLRALIYFHLVRKWGDVPMTTVPLTTIDQIKAATFRVKSSVVYQQIVADMTDAAKSNLPVVQPAANRGRVSLQAVNAFLGQVYLTRYTTIDGGTNAKDLDSANYYLSACYAMRTFSTLSSIPYTDVFDVNKKATCPELIWQIVYIQGDPNTAAPTYHSNVAADNQALGETINSLRPGTGAGNNVTHDLVNEYEANDPRGTFSIKFANAPSIQDWFVTKYRDTSPTASNKGFGGNDWILMRYADVILMLAEVNMYQGNNAGAIQYMDMVRARAGMPSYEVSSTTDASYMSKFTTLKLALLHERRVELAFEHHRWFDLLSFFNINDLVTYMNSKNKADFGTAKLANFSNKDEYFPIPYGETILDPVKMYQNPGY